MRAYAIPSIKLGFSKFSSVNLAFEVFGVIYSARTFFVFFVSFIMLAYTDAAFLICRHESSLKFCLYFVTRQRFEG